MNSRLPEVVMVDKDKCVNCHACIAACPVKYCNDGSTDVVSINSDMCIACGCCIKACSHEARYYIDDSEQFFRDLGQIPMVAVVAPAIAANFPNQYLRINGWMKSAGIEACFDVSFGAELTIKSYLEHIKTNKPKAVIAQPCPAIVNYIEIYQPELLDHLAPADSPMLHIIKMVKEFYPQYRNHMFAVISPCMAKKREFDETGLGDYNVTYRSLNSYFDKNRISLSSYDEVDYDNPPAERAVLFSTPGGLLQTALREVPEAASFSRKIEGPEIIYEYLKKLPESVRAGYNPLLIDCLNCEMGCNGGTGTDSIHKGADEVEWLIEQRNLKMQQHYKSKGINGIKKGKKALADAINKHWKPNLYSRSYRNLSSNNLTRIPHDSELKEVYKSINKYNDEDIYNCGACGYGSCMGMAIALYNGLNQPSNCLHNQYALLHDHNKKVAESVKKLTEMVFAISDRSSSIASNSSNVSAAAQQVSGSVNSVSISVTDAQGVMSSINKAIDGLTETIQEIANNSERTRNITSSAVESVQEMKGKVDLLAQASESISSVIDTIIEIAEQTKLLALNATIEAARAGDAGKGFAVVASEVKDLARQTNEATVDIKNKILNISQSTGATIEGIKNIGDVINNINEFVSTIAAAVEEQTITTRDIADNVSRNAKGIDSIAKNVTYSASGTQEIASNISEVNNQIKEIAGSVENLNNQAALLNQLTEQRVTTEDVSISKRSSGDR